MSMQVLLKVFFFIWIFVLQLQADPTEDLFDSVRKRNIIGISRAVEEGADINAGNEWNTTPLMLAVHFGALNIVKALLENKADPNVINYRNETALRIACQKNAIDIINTLIDHGADVNEEDVNGAKRGWRICADGSIERERNF